MPHDDFAPDPGQNVSAHLPPGEEILWQGRPDAFALARQAFGLYWVVAYFVLLTVWRFVTVVDLMPLGQAIGAAVPFVFLGVIVCALFYLTALIQARATLYTVTSARVVMRIGAALTVTLNIPYRELANAALDRRAGGTGTIALETSGKARLSYLVCWPHVRPWQMNPTQPALRCVPDADKVAQIMSEAARTRLSEPRVALRPVAAE